MSWLQELSAFLAADQIKTDGESLQHYGRDWTTYFDIKAQAILFPKSAEDVQKIVLWARKHKIALVPSGGRTGLSGAACATQGEVVISFEKMNRILDFNPTEQSVLIEAGVITEQLQKYAEDKGLYYPVDFAARGSSQMGGNIATNAGGIKVVRYGLTRNWVLGLKVVTGQGEILDLNKSLIKNATGYDLRHLFIGSEGTLGFITHAYIQLAPPPPPLQVLFLGAASMDSIMEIFAAFKKNCKIVAFEMLSDIALNQVLTHTHLPKAIETKCDYYVLVESEKSSEEDETQILNTFEQLVEAGHVVDGAMAQSDQQAKNFWRLREDISESLAPRSPYKNDISVTTSKVPAFMRDLDKIIQSSYPTWEVVWFGHIGDGNLHINILRPAGMSKEDFVKECQKVDVHIFDCIQKQEGSISAEHGVGLTKKKFLNYTRSSAEIEIMKGIKKVFDPDNIINPGKVF